MLTLLPLFVFSLGITLAMTPLFRDIALRINWVDLPDARKVHSTPVPRVGGIAVFIAYVSALALLAFTPLNQGGAGAMTIRLLPAAVVVFATGLMDDRWGLLPWQKILGQVGGAVLACLAGVRITGLGHHEVDPWLGVPLTLLWLVACTNAFNLIDGLDGLAAGIGLFATLTTFVAALLNGDLRLAVATAPLAGALVGFLKYNFNRATVFLGDSGSLFVGFLLGCYSVIWSHKCATILGMTAPLMTLAVPMCDTAVAVIRRFVGCKPIFGADRAHIHHRLIDLGLTPRRVVILLYMVSGAAAFLALVQNYVSNEARGLVLLVFCISLWVGIRRLGYEEFRAVAELVRFKLVRELLSERLQLRSLEKSLAAATTPAECWDVVREAARAFGFNSVALRMGGHIYTDDFQSSSNGNWFVRIPLLGSDFLQLTHEFDSDRSAYALTPFVDFVHGVLGQSGRNGARATQEPEAATLAHGRP